MELISREEAIQSLVRWSCSECGLGLDYKKNKGFCEGICHGANAIKVIESIPTIEERKEGHWIRDGHHIRCSECYEYICDKDREGDTIPQNYCPNCGARMKGE